MWTDRETTLDLTHNPEELWFAGIFGRPVAKPTPILKWEQNTNVYQLITKKFPRTKASAVLDDLGIIAEYAKTIVRQRQTFRSNSKAENIASLTFEYNPDGEFALVAAMLRSKRAPSKPAEEGTKAKGGEDEKKDDDLESITGIDPIPIADPPNSSDVEDASPADIIFQNTLLEPLTQEVESGVGKKDKKIVQMYLSLNASEFLYVRA